MIKQYIDPKTKTIQKDKIAADGNKDLLSEVIGEEGEIISLVQQIVYWSHQPTFKDMVCHQIIILTKQILKLLQITDKKLHELCDQHKYHDFERVHTNVDKSKHIVELARMNEAKIKSGVKRIAALIKDYKESKMPFSRFTDSINETCVDLMEGVGLDETHLQAAHDMVAEHKAAEKKGRLRRFRNIRR